MSLGEFWKRLYHRLLAENTEVAEMAKEIPKGFEVCVMASGDIHIAPLEDLEPHTFQSLTCPCQPTRAVAYILHNAFDGRDIIERVEMGLPL